TVSSPNLRTRSSLFPDGSIHPNVLEVKRLQLDLDLGAVISGDMPLRRITIVDPKLYIEINEDLTTPLGNMLRPTEEMPSGAVDLPEVIVENLEVRTCPQSAFRMEEPLKVDRFALTLLEDQEYEFSATASYPLVRRVRLSGTGNREALDFDGKLEFSRLHLDNSVRDRLPKRFRSIWNEYQPSGMANSALEFSIRDGRIDDWRVELQIIEANLTLEAPPVELASVYGSIEVLPEQRAAGDEVLALRFPGRIRTVKPLRGRAFGGEAELSGSIGLEDLAVVDDDLRLKLEHIPLDDKTRSYLIGSLQTAYDALHPRGNISLELRTRSGAEREVHLEKLSLEDVTIRPSEFPYPVERLTGDIVFREDRYQVQLDGGTESTPIRVSGFLGLDSGSAAHIQVRVEDLQLDSRLRRALPPILDEVWELVGPGGLTHVDFSLVREENAPRALVEVKLTPTDASVRYQDFPYPIRSVTGEVTVSGDLLIGDETEYVTRSILMEGLRGRHGDSEVILDVGEIRLETAEQEAFELILKIRSPSLLVDEDVISALPADAATMLRRFNVDGRVQTEVLILVDAQTELEVEVQTRIETPLRVQYDALPYPLAFRSGNTIFTMSDQSVRFENFETDPAEGPRIQLSGSSTHDAETNRENQFILLKIDPGNNGLGLRLDDPQLIAALPADARNLLEELDVKGYATCDLSTRYSFMNVRPEEDAQEELEYGGTVSVLGGALNVGLQLEEISGDLGVSGTAGMPRLEGGKREKHHFSIAMNNGSFRFSRFLTKAVKATFSYGKLHPVLEGSDPLPESVPSPEFKSRLSGPGQTEQTLQVHLREADLYGGNLRGFFFIDVGIQKDFLGAYRVDGVDLSIGGQEIFKSDGILGKGRGEVIFSGAIDAPDRLWGQGNLSIVDGRLKQIPLMANVLRNPLFGLLEGLDPEQNYVRKVIGNFQIEPNRFRVRKYEDLLLETG
ncbi:MAG: hypothetical protein AAF488_15850, partial [Planctomycetota bacterium]